MNISESMIFFHMLHVYQVIQRANGVKYGLSASVWSKDVGRVHRVAHRLQVNS